MILTRPIRLALALTLTLILVLALTRHTHPVLYCTVQVVVVHLVLMALLLGGNTAVIALYGATYWLGPILVSPSLA